MNTYASQAIGVLALMFAMQWQLTVITFMAVPLITLVSKVPASCTQLIPSLAFLLPSPFLVSDLHCTAVPCI